MRLRRGRRAMSHVQAERRIDATDDLRRRRGWRIEGNGIADGLKRDEMKLSRALALCLRMISA